MRTASLVNWPRSTAATRPTGAGRGAGVVGIAARPSGSSRLAAWPCCEAGLATTEDAVTAGHPSITVGGKRLWRNRSRLDATDMNEQQWRQKWDAGAHVFDCRR